MHRRSRAALCLFLMVLASTLGAVARGETPAWPGADGKQIRGFSMQLNNPSGTAEYIAAIDELSAMGCTSINFVIAARQNDVKAEKITVIWDNMPSYANCEKICKHAKAKGIYTILMPIVLLDKAGTKEWRGVIDPPSWDNWFFSYGKYMKTMSTLAKKCDIDLFCVGSELLSTEDKRNQWIRVIADIKTVYKGKLTYSANWDHYEFPTFWDQLDYIGMNNYNELADKPGATVAQLDQKWTPIKEKILAFVQKQGKPFLFTEVGWHNLQNTIAEPWNYVAEGPIDLTEQEKAYKSFVDTWKDVPNSKFMGALIWEWRPGCKGATEHGVYSLQGTPALDVVKKWMKVTGS